MRSNNGSLQASLANAECAVDDLVDAVGGDLRFTAHDDLSAALVAVRTLRARLDCVSVMLVGEVDRRGSHVDDACLSAAAWVRMHTRSSPGEAAAAVRTARVLRSGALPGTEAAFREGEIDLTHVRVIADGVSGAPHGAARLIEPEVLEAARRSDPREVAGIMRMFRHALDPDASDAAALARHDRRGFWASPTLNGMVSGNFYADEVSGSVIMTAVDAASPLVAGDRRTAAQRRLDGITEICRRYLGSPDAPMSGGGHSHVIVTMDSDTAHGGPGSVGSPGATISWVGPVPGSTARRVACDSDVTLVRVGPGAATEVVERQRRFFTWAQRKAMIARDGDRCAAPFCDRPVSWSDGHHLVGWEHGGPTTTENGALPCAAHHTMLHEGGWSLERLPDGRYVLCHPDGKTIGPELRSTGHSRPPPHRRE